MRKFIYFLTTVLGLLTVYPASLMAAYFDATIYDMDANQRFISRRVYNDTPRTNLYTIKAYKIARPGQGNERELISAEKELVWSPLKFIIQPEGREFFKLYYRGAEDDKERYYRVIFEESPISFLTFQKDSKTMGVVPVVAMSTILVVRPRDLHFNYEINESVGIIKNTGNTYFRVILQTGCNGSDMNSFQFYMLPGESWKGNLARANNRKFIVGLGQYHRLGEGCFKSDDQRQD